MVMMFLGIFLQLQIVLSNINRGGNLGFNSNIQPPSHQHSTFLTNSKTTWTPIENMTNTTIWNSKTIQEGVGWKVVNVRNANIFLINSLFSLDGESFRSKMSGHNIFLSACNHNTTTKLKTEQPHNKINNQKILYNSSHILMLKLATTGSTWIGDLLSEMPNTKFTPELITGSDASKLTDNEKINKIKHKLSLCQEDHKICGISLNSKDSASLQFPIIASQNNILLVVWIRSNIIAYTIGLIRASELTKGKCHTNNVRIYQANKCELPKSISISMKDFKWHLKKASLFSAINIGSAYSSLNCNTNKHQHDDRNYHGTMTSRYNVYELYYEEMLENKAKTLKRFIYWLGFPELINNDDTVPKDKTVKSVSSQLKEVIKNYDEVHNWLDKYQPCLVQHLESNGHEIMPICPLGFDPLLSDDEELWEKVALFKEKASQKGKKLTV